MTFLKVGELYMSVSMLTYSSWLSGTYGCKTLCFPDLSMLALEMDDLQCRWLLDLSWNSARPYHLGVKRRMAAQFQLSVEFFICCLQFHSS